MDYGNLWQTPSKFSPYQINIATGIGLRYYTIIGPIRFDIAFKFYDYAPDSGTNKWLYQNSFNIIMTKKLTLQFGIGNTF
jgi:outer membrane protein assembly factor BamA